MKEMVLVLLGICTIYDVRTKKIPAMILWVFTALSVIQLVVTETFGTWMWVYGMITGGACLLISIISRGGLGKGDAWILAITGLALGWQGNVQLLFGAMLMAMLVGVFLVASKKQTMQSALPFVPCLLINYIIMLCRW